MAIKSFKELTVWQRAMELVGTIYEMSGQLPAKEQYALISQMIRAVISIPSNIAEGWARNHKIEFIRYLSIAYGSACELETQLTISKKQYSNIDYSQADNLLDEVQKMLTVLMKKLKNHEQNW
ncbi:MAG: four helix bundle protein [bacterium]|nr:four helix bundle protein [bacterium]